MTFDTEAMVEALERAPIPIQVIRLGTPDDPGSFYPVFCNEACSEALGQDLKSDFGKPWRETSPELATSSFGSKSLAALAAQKTISWEEEYGDSRFAQNWWRVVVKPLDERTLMMCLQNTTAEKEVEFELKRSHAELDRFAYIASHDIKAPLRDIDNLAKWVIEDAKELPESSLRHLQQLRQRAQRLNKLLVELLEFSRVLRRDYEHETFSLGTAFANVEESVSSRDGFAVQFEGGDIEMQTARAPLETVLRNLVSNAIKHHDRDSGNVTVAARVRGEAVEFTVEDDGPGIPPELHEKAFAMLETLRRVEGVEGTGLGLSIAKKLVESYGDALELESRDGRGCRFSFSWPRRSA